MTPHQNDQPAADGETTNAKTPRAVRPNIGDAAGDNPDVLVRLFLDALCKLWLQLKAAFNFVMQDLGGYQAIDGVIRWAVRNPHLAICIVAGCLVTLLPVLLLISFGVMTLFMTFTGLIVLEGVMLSIVLMLLLGCIGALVVVVYLIKQINQVS